MQKAVVVLILLLTLTTPAQALTCGDRHTPVSSVQGTGDATPMAGERVTVEGVMTVDLRGPGGFGGFYLQQAGAEQDDDPATSEGIFIHTSAGKGKPGDRIRVRGEAGEYYGLTSLSDVEAVDRCGSPGLPEPVVLTGGPGVRREALEGMLVNTGSPLVVTDTWNLARYGELVLAPTLNWIPTQRQAPGPDIARIIELQEQNRLILDDRQRRQNPRPIPWPPKELRPDNPVRTGDRVAPFTGVLDYRFGNWRLQPVATPGFVASNPRQAAPGRHPHANLRVVALNLGNLFNGDGQGQGFPTARGAQTHNGYQRQLDRLAAQIRATDADILAVSELENDGYHPHSALAELAAELGQSWRYARGNTDSHDDDIRNALLYRSDRVQAVAPAELIDNGPFRRWHRPALAQGFKLTGGSETLTVVAVHLKSKSCRNAPGPQRDSGDGQACFAAARTDAARALARWRPSGGSEHSPVLLAGDFNAYAMEDPLTVLREEGYSDLVRRFHGTGAGTFRYHGRHGTLDYHLANEALAGRVLASRIWSVNAEEPRIWAYSADNGIAAVPKDFPWRASDHNPVITDLRLEQ